MKTETLIKAIPLILITLCFWNHPGHADEGSRNPGDRPGRAEEGCYCVDIHTFPGAQEDQVGYAAKCYKKDKTFTTIYNTTYTTKEAEKITEKLKKYKRCVFLPGGQLLVPTD